MTITLHYYMNTMLQYFLHIDYNILKSDNLILVQNGPGI